MNRTATIWACTAALVLAACQPDTRLPGERFDIDLPLEASLPEGQATGAARPLPLPARPAAEGPRAFAAPAMVAPADWPQRGLNAGHRLPHLAFAGTFQTLWSAPIGAGQDRRHRITADPVVAGGRVFTLDAAGQVMAHATSGASAGGPLWRASLVPAGERGPAVSGGGLAVAEGRLLATSGYGGISALDPATGALLWRQDLGAVGDGAPVVQGGLVYVMGRDNRAWALDLRDGKVVWTLNGPPGGAGYVGGAGVAVDGRIAVLPFAGGQASAVLRQSGVTSWNTLVGGQSPGLAYAGRIRDVGADPVLDGGRVYLSNAAGRLAALDSGRGERLWTAEVGTAGTPVVAGGSLFLISDANELVRLDAARGATIWSVQLPDFVAKKVKNRRAIWGHRGPLLAGGKLIVASNDGLLRAFDPASGALVREVALPGGGAATNPVIAGGTLYLVTTKGTLLALR